MRKSSAFVAIPTVPTRVSGQWLTFSHMANHYRKLLNVKPRVHSNAPKKQSSSSVKALQASTLKLCTKLSSSTTGQYKDRRDSDSVQSNTALRSKKSVVPKISSYQILFDQSELKNLSEAVMSDSDYDDEPHHLHQMPISEKINLYLDQLHDPGFDDKNSIVSSASQFGSLKPVAKVTSKARGLGRHSKCFIPFVQTEKVVGKSKSPKSKPINRIPPKPKKLTGNSNLSQSKVQSQQKKSLPKTELKVSAKAGPSTKKVEKNASSYSGSIGTVAGSYYLSEKVYVPSLVSESIDPKLRKVKRSNTNCLGSSTQKLEELLNSEPDWVTNKSNPEGLLVKMVNNRSKKSHPCTFPSGNFNKDSSRDSAYGLSSGESKITTRESTPEKRKARSKKVTLVSSKSNGMSKYKSNLSTVASSINQESMSDPLPIKGQGIPSVKSHSSLALRNGGELKRGLVANLIGTDKYINFITAVTDDIIKREVFTNKGLKSLFNAHVEANKDLEMDKMLQMLDRLRMDVGIPKDDYLDQMDFGYGSIKYSTTSIFTQRSHSQKDILDSIPRPGPSHRPGMDTTGVISTSDTTIRHLHGPRAGKGFNSGDESSKISSCSVSVGNETPEHPQDVMSFRDDVVSRDSDRSSPPSSKSSELSLTESEILKILGQVGFRADAALDIAQITKHGRKSHHHGGSKVHSAEMPLNLNKAEEMNNNKVLVSKPRHPPVVVEKRQSSSEIDYSSSFENS